MSDVVAKRCSICANNWPDRDKYKTCPICDEPTWACRDADPLTEAEANEIVAGP